MKREMNVRGVKIGMLEQKSEDYISLTDIARKKNPLHPKDVVSNWLRSITTIDFLGLWESINNPNFKGVEFEALRNNAGFNYYFK